MKDLLKVLVFGGLFLIPFLPIYVENDFFFPFITGKNFAFRIIIEIVFASWILLALYDERYRPKFSWILAGFSSLLVVMFFANLFGEYPLKSFMSNFERMDGYITLAHVFMYLVVAGSVLTTEKLWSYFFHTSVAVTLYVALYGLAQHTGMIEGGRDRIDSRLGNAAYMAIYLLFHIFIVFYLFVRSKVTIHRVIYALIAVIFIYTLLLTGTRGTFLGFVGGTTVSVAYIALFGQRHPQYRKAAVAAIGIIIILGGLFFAMRDSAFVQDSNPLRRIANINIAEDLVVRGTIWSLAVDGVKERPLLGWGQGNFNYVFNQNFDPTLWHAESWFDRVHNIFLDWLIAGGVLGLIAYFSIFFAALYYLFWQPLFRKDIEPTFSVLERAVLVGLLAGYLMHNLVVFDNIISYIFYGSILALIHARVSTPIAGVQAWRMDERLINQFAAPIIILVMGASVYFVNVPGIKASADLIDALQAQTLVGRLTEFDSAISRDSFADQEIIEQLVQNAMNIARNQNLPAEERDGFVQRAELEMMRLTDEKPGDARIHTFFATFYRSIGAYPQAKEQAEIARSLSPKKQAIIIEQGVIELQMQNAEAAKEFFKEAFELDETNHQARVLYAATLVSLGELDAAKELIGDEHMNQFAANDFALSVVHQSGDRELLIKMFDARIAARPNNAQNYASLAFVYHEAGETEKAVEVLSEAADTIPDFTATAQCFIGNIEAGKSPNEGC